MLQYWERFIVSSVMVKKFEIVDLYSYVYDRVRKEKARRTEVNQGNSNGLIG